jgi:hypothetical protein
MSVHDNALFAHIAALEHWVASLHMASTAADGARGFDAAVARSSLGPSPTLASSADDDCRANDDNTSLESSADDDSSASAGMIIDAPRVARAAAMSTRAGELSAHISALEPRVAATGAWDHAHGVVVDDAPRPCFADDAPSVVARDEDDARAPVVAASQASGVWEDDDDAFRDTLHLDRDARAQVAAASRVYDVWDPARGMVIDYAAGSTTLGSSSAEVDGARGVAADDARSSPGPGTSVRDSDGVDGDYHARNDLAAAWYSWLTSPSGTSNPRHLTKRLRAARGAFRRLDGLPPLLARWSAPRPGRTCSLVRFTKRPG